jgi:2-polyprenyl-6-methoxyphenol hydroxylase-like FAD-dependent oxidoreductase
MCKADGTVMFAAPPVSPYGPDMPGVGGIMRPMLHGILQRATRAAGVEVGLGQRLVGIEQGAEGVTAELSDGSRASFDLLVGADGINSTVRSILFPEAPLPAFTGQGCWRAVVPRPPELTGPMMFFGRQKCGLNPVSEAQMYLFLLQNVADNRWLPEAQWPELLKAELEEFTAPLLRTISDELDHASLIVYRPLEAGMTPPPWHRGRVLLIGDAAHATTPHSAYGAALGIEDAIVLAEELATGGGLEAALQRFMDRRYERCRAVVEGSVLQGELEQRGASMEEFSQASQAVSRVVLQPI